MRCSLLALAGLPVESLAWSQPAEDGQWTMAAHDHANTRFSSLDRGVSCSQGRILFDTMETGRQVWRTRPGHLKRCPVVWLLGFHTTHLLTDVFDSVMLGVLFLTGPLETRRFTDVSENSFYWSFVVFSWLPSYLAIYWGARAV